MNILFYTPFSYRSRDTESVMTGLKRTGHNVYYLSQVYGKEIQDVLSKNGIVVENSLIKNNFSLLNLIKEFFFLIRFCWRNKIDVVFSHLEPAGFVSVFFQYFVKARVVICRHHVDEMHLAGKDKLLSYRLIYKLGKEFIVVSARAKEFMVTHEGVNPKKINVINLLYDFNLYEKVNEQTVNDIKTKYPAEILLLIACRLTKDKRPDLAIEVLIKLKEKFSSVKLLILGIGEMENELRDKIKRDGLENECFMLGRLTDIQNYITASDFLLSPSLIDSSSVIIKEAGLCKKTAIVCKDVGDCEEYMINGYNGILVDKDNFVAEATVAIKKVHSRELDQEAMGENLNKSVHQLFDITNGLYLYDKFLN